LTKIGEWLEKLREDNETLFSVGSSGIEMALGNYWNLAGALKARSSWPQPENAKPLLVISGSCSPVTTSQIEYAKANGFEEIIIDAEKDVLERTIKILKEGKNLIVHTGIRKTEPISAEITGKTLGSIAREAIINTSIKRIVVAGGDTSSHAAIAMEIDALEMIAPMVSGAPLCKIHSGNKSINGIEINLKGGQVGGKDYFLLFTNT
jgi:3-oxoisoapionate kinase